MNVIMKVQLEEVTENVKMAHVNLKIQKLFSLVVMSLSKIKVVPMTLNAST